MKKTLLLLLLTCSCAIAAAQERSPLRQTEFISADSLEDEHELLERVRNMPNLEVGKGITFRPKSNWFSLTMRFRMQNMVGLSFDKDFTLTKTDAQVKRLRLRFDSRGEHGWQLKTVDLHLAGAARPLRIFVEAEIE